jgi:hypothetical protein
MKFQIIIRLKVRFTLFLDNFNQELRQTINVSKEFISEISRNLKKSKSS